MTLPPPPAPRPWILHVDLDQFLAAVEVRRHPELTGRPVVVGGNGDPTRARQVVASASYEARAFGVHAGMPLKVAARRCPDAVFLAGDHPAYEAASAEVMDALRGLGHPVEVWGWDEAVLGATTDDPRGLADRIRRHVLDATALSCSVGIGENTSQAKLATGFGKPGGVGMLTGADWPAVMFPRPVAALQGVGVKTARKLAAMGIATVGDLAGADPAVLTAAFGPSTGGWLAVAGRGGGATTVDPTPWVPRSRSRVVTYETDLTDRDRMDAEVTAMAAQLTADIAADGRTVHRVAVTVRTASFFTRSRIRKLPAPTVDPDVVAATARDVLAAFPLDRPVRLLGVRVELDPPATRTPPETPPPPAAAGGGG
ncbi:DNA polymerase IV [Nakamurella deserti]|uniref:DNA polymerase IV n=1 Tax=Nakamurella deserti TaxID=2164074 RepID=UPI000DBE4F8C|nr:DNA polymerase IV [Nakamurella deserti]